jgi:hypothetical protein
MPFPPRRRPNPFVSGPPRGGRRRTTPDVVGIPNSTRATQVAPRWANPAMSKAEAQMRAKAKRLMKADLSNRLQARPFGRAGNKGMAVTKKAIGYNDFRKGGLTLSIVDNLKK